MATPMLLVIAVVGMTDVLFAVDSIPAIFAITEDPFIVLSSNIFAILGQRAMHFLLAAMAARFQLLSYGLALVLAFIGTKMLLIDVVKIPVLVSLAVVVAILAATMLLSLLTAPKPLPSRKSAPAGDARRPPPPRSPPPRCGGCAGSSIGRSQGLCRIASFRALFALHVQGKWIHRQQKPRAEPGRHPLERIQQLADDFVAVVLELLRVDPGALERHAQQRLGTRLRPPQDVVDGEDEIGRARRV